IACHDEGRLYIVPVSYAFDNGYIYCHSMDGLKIKMMRNNPRVCFQVDDIDNMTNWRSVIAWGDYEELQQKEYDSGLEILKNKFTPFITSDAVNPFQRPEPTRSSIIEKAKKVIVFRIKIIEQSGRFEKS